MKKRRFRRLHGLSEQMALQITPMADVFVILLVFLIKSLSTGMTTVTPSQNFLLPEATATDEVVETLRIEISRDLVLFEDRPVAKLTEFHIPLEDLEADGTVRSLNEALLRRPSRSPAAAVPAGGIQLGQPIMVMADEKAPYGLVRTVVRTLSRRGYPDLKLVVVQSK